MEMILKRCRHSGNAIDGHLFIDDTKICDTAENAKGALREGEYQVSIHKCKQYGRKVLVLKASTRCEACPKLDFVCYNPTLPVYCPMLKPGNGVHKRLDGSIILGTYIVPGCLMHPKQAFDAVYDRIRKSIQRGNSVTLKITNQ